MTKKTPTYQDFLDWKKGGKVGPVALFCRSLQPGVPKRFDVQAGQETGRLQTQIIKNASRNGYRIRTMTIDGELWACRVKDEDEHLSEQNGTQP